MLQGEDMGSFPSSPPPPPTTGPPAAPSAPLEGTPLPSILAIFTPTPPVLCPFGLSCGVPWFGGIPVAWLPAPWGSQSRKSLPFGPQSLGSQSLGAPHPSCSSPQGSQSHKSPSSGSQPPRGPNPLLQSQLWGCPAPIPLGGSQPNLCGKGGVPIPDPQPKAGGPIPWGHSGCLRLRPTALTGVSTSTRNPSPTLTTL